MEESYFSELVSVEPNQIKARANTNVYLVIGLQISNGFDIFHWSDGGQEAKMMAKIGFLVLTNMFKGQKMKI